MAIDHASGVNSLTTASDSWHVRDRAFTAMCWQKFDTAPGAGAYWSILAGYTNNNGWGLYMSNAGSAEGWTFGWQNGPGNFSSFPGDGSGSAAATGVWLHVAVVYDSGSSRSWRIYVNGFLRNSVASETQTFPSTSAPFRIGHDPDNPTAPDGQTAYVKVFEGALSQAEILAEMSSAVPVNRRAPCSGDYPLTPNGSNTVYAPDRSFRLAHANTVNGTVTWAVNADPPVLVQRPSLRVHEPYLWGSVAGGGTDLVVANATHAETAGNLALTQVHSLALANALHGVTSTNLALTQVHSLAVASALHGQTAQNLVLTQVHILAIANALHGQTADNITFSGGASLTVANANHAQTSQNLTLTQIHNLLVASAQHGQTAQNLSLTQTHIMALANANHAQTASNLVLSLGVIETPAGRVLVVLADGRLYLVPLENRSHGVIESRLLLA